MAIIVLSGKATKKEVRESREEHRDYVKITIDINQKLAAIGGEYHADAEKILLEDYGSNQSDIWGGGYNVASKEFETIAIINMRQNPENRSMDILDSNIRNKFLEIAREFLSNIESNK